MILKRVLNEKERRKVSREKNYKLNSISIVILIAFASRLICLSIVFTVRFYLPNIELRKSTKLFWILNDSRPQQNSSAIPLKSSHPLLEGLLRWDSEYFLFLSHSGYLSQRVHAFFPGYPLLIYLLSIPFSQSFLTYAIIALIISNLSFVFATIALFYYVQFMLTLTNKKIHSKKTVDSNVILTESISIWCCLLFCLNPGSIFMSSIYTESLFTFLTLTAFNLQLSNELNMNSFLSKKQFLSILFMALSNLIRSNGILNLIILFFQTLRTSPKLNLNTYSKTSNHNNINHNNINHNNINHSNINHSNINHSNTSYSNRNGYCQFFIHWSIALFYALMIILPFTSVLGFGYSIYCTNNFFSSPPSLLNHFIKPIIPNTLIFFKRLFDSLTNIIFRRGREFGRELGREFGREFSWELNRETHPEFCFTRFPNIYSSVQKSFWNVKFFAYFQLIKIDRFIIAIPFIGMALSLIIKELPTSLFARNPFNAAFLNDLSSLVFSVKFGYLFQLVVVVFIMTFSANVEVIVRMLSSCPLFWMALACTPDPSKHPSTPYSWFSPFHINLFNVYLFWHCLCFFIGPIYFAVWMTWT